MHKCMFSNCTHLMHFIFNIFIIIIHVVIPFKIFLWQLKQLFNKINKINLKYVKSHIDAIALKSGLNSSAYMGHFFSILKKIANNNSQI